MWIIEILRYEFIQKAFIAGSFVGITCAVLGMFLVLRKMSLIGDGLSHISFGAIALGLFLGIYPFYVAIPVVMAGSLIILTIADKAKVYGDAAIGIVSVVGISAGVILSSLSNGFNTDLYSYLFGNILAISETEVVLSVILSGIVMTVLYYYYWDLFSATFDEEYARTTGVRTGYINAVITLLTAITVVLSVKVVGVMLVSALLIIPSVTALQVARNFRTAMVIAAMVSLISVISGITVSYILDLPAGATVVMVSALLFGLALVYRKFT